VTFFWEKAGKKGFGFNFNFNFNFKVVGAGPHRAKGA